MALKNFEGELWRAASQADGLPAFLDAAAAALEPILRITALSVWSLDGSGRALTPMAASGGSPVLAAIVLGESERRRFAAWHRRQAVTAWMPGDRDEGPSGLFSATSGAAGLLLLPILAGASAGLVLVSFPRRTRVTADARQALALLAGPLSAAIDHAQRVDELRALRHAAEADRDTLLRRLGRERLSEEIVGADAGLKPVLDRVGLVARSDLPVLIFGETGAGKEVIARAVHERSPRADRPFIRVNCGAIPPDLIDSELFGHERGSFTGATAQRRGWFEQADSGTLFLDEIGDLPLPAQVRLLRVLQDGTLHRVGGQQPVHVDVRIVAATHRDLPALVERKEFREDLWYRLASFPIFLPPLRERPGDIAPLAEHLVRRAARRFGLPAARLSAHDLTLLQSYTWPGNVRELASVIDRAVIVGEGRSLAIDIALGAPAPARPARRATDAPPPAVRADDDSLDGAMRRHIESVLRRTRGIIEGPHGAAAMLRINPHTLRARMRKLKIAWRDFRGPA